MKRKSESIADFKSRIAGIMRGGAPEPIIGAKPAPPFLVRKPSSRGYYPPPRAVPLAKK